jgi:hypothetical protein
MSEKYNIYCDLVISSRTNGELPNNVFLTQSLRQFEFIDNESPERAKLRLRWAQSGRTMNEFVSRFWWSISSRNHVNSNNLLDHVNWLLGNLKKNRSLLDSFSSDYVVCFSAFWGEGNGTGSGPTISCELAEKLASIRVPLEIGIYLD